MPFKSVQEIVYETLPFKDETPENDALILSFKETAMVTLQKPLGKSDLTDVELFDEGNYSNMEILMVGYYTSWLILCQYITEESTKTDLESGQASDISEITTTSGKVKLSESFTKVKAEELVGKHKTKMCGHARSMGLTLGDCSNGSPDPQSKRVYVPPRFFEDC